ncbi:MAG: metal-dependent hydrolase, partial [Chryseobacterium sp.]|nr:metal-dependent hydrolase [Chryseobacterium sp.]
SDPFYNFQAEKSAFDISAQKIDYVLITHAHGDHTADVKEVLLNYPDATIIGQPEICGYFNHENQIDLNLGGTAFLEGLEITMLPASHTSSFPDGTYGGQPAGYMFRIDGENLYFAGDTGLMADMKWFPEKFGKIKASILPIGGHYTMDAETASFAAAEFLKTEKVIGCHFDTFPPITINHHEAQHFFSKRNVVLILPKIGEEIEF